MLSEWYFGDVATMFLLMVAFITGIFIGMSCGIEKERNRQEKEEYIRRHSFFCETDKF